MLHKTIRDDDFQRNTAIQYCCDIVLNGCNIVPTLQRKAALEIVVSNRLVLRSATTRRQRERQQKKQTNKQ